MLPAHIALLVGAGVLAGGMNAVAGGGTFLTLPALLFAGLPPVVANASSTVALVPGSVASAWVYRGNLAPLPGTSWRAMLVATLAGGLAGAMLLLATPERTFDRLVPWLLLVGTLAFTFGRWIGTHLRRLVHMGPRSMIGGQLLLGVYGGYFGGGVGIMMMALWTLCGVEDLHAMNASRTVLGASTNAIAVVWFVAAGVVRWPEALVMLVAAMVGGYLGAHLTLRLDQRVARIAITAIGFVMTAVLFLRR